MHLPVLASQLRRAVWLCCVLACLAIYGYLGVWLPLHATGYDFTGPYEAAYALAHHAPLQVYDVPAQRAYNDAVLHLPDGPSDFRWTPPTAVLLIPLALLPYRAARVAWWVLGQAGLVVSLWLLARCVMAAIGPRYPDRSSTLGRAHDARRGRERNSGAPVSGEHRTSLPFARGKSWTKGPPWVAFLVLFCAAAIAQPVTDSLRLGQSTTILLLGFALITYGEVFDRQALSGIGLGLAILDKLFPAVLLLYFLWRGRYRLCAVAAGLVALLTVVTLPVTGLGMYGAFVQALRTYSNEPNAGPVNLSLAHALIVGPSAVLRPGQPEPTTGPLPVLATLLCAALFGVFLLAQGRAHALGWWLRRAGRTLAGRDAGETTRQRLFAVSWAVCSLLALEPIDWIFYYLLLLVPLAWLLTRPDRALEGSHGTALARGWWFAALLAYTVATLPLPLDSRSAPPMSPVFVIGICVRPAALLVLWVAHAVHAFGWRRSLAVSAAPVREPPVIEAPEAVK